MDDVQPRQRSLRVWIIAGAFLLCLLLMCVVATFVTCAKTCASGIEGQAAASEVALEFLTHLRRQDFDRAYALTVTGGHSPAQRPEFEQSMRSLPALLTHRSAVVRGANSRIGFGSMPSASQFSIELLGPTPGIAVMTVIEENGKWRVQNVNFTPTAPSPVPVTTDASAPDASQADVALH